MKSASRRKEDKPEAVRAINVVRTALGSILPCTGMRVQNKDGECRIKRRRGAQTVSIAQATATDFHHCRKSSRKSPGTFAY
jgi:hypothetical protein